MRYLGIDYGSKKVGIAFSDEAGTMGFPHGVLLNAPELLETVVTLIKKENIGAVVIGESKDFNEKDNPIAEAARAFGARLKERTGVPMQFEDERLTSAHARRDVPEHLVDAAAAALILTNYLEKHGQH